MFVVILGSLRGGKPQRVRRYQQCDAAEGQAAWSTCGLSSRLAQVLTGHGHYGGYYRRFVPLERSDCRCGAELQSREHILTECPLYDHVRHHLEKVDRHISLPRILGTPEGRQALIAFLRDSDAFQKKQEGTVADRPAPPAVPEPTIA
jgi:hypothetical protein